MSALDLGPLNAFAAENDLPPTIVEAVVLTSLNGKPALELPGDGRPMGDFALDVGLALRGRNIFTRGGLAFTLDGAALKLEPASPTWLRSWAEKYVCTFKARGRAGDIRLASTMGEDAARVVLSAPQFLEQLRKIERINPCRLPIIRADGTLELLPEGHDADSSTYTAEGVNYPQNMGADEAREIIEKVVAEFPFAEDAGRSKAVAIGAMLTVFAGGLMPQGALRPVFLYLGNAEGTGKTTLAKIAGIPYGSIAAESAPTDEAEWQKKLLATVISGRRLVLLDNLKGSLNSPSLEAFTTSSKYSGRILGVSKEFSGESCATVLVTGNSLTISPDMRRRSLVCELFMTELRAEDRHFKRRLDDPALLAMRPALLGACWALVRSWNEAGRPPASRMNSSFASWCDTIGGIVEHAGFACPTAPAELAGMGDTDTRDIARLAAEIVPRARYTFAELAELCGEHGIFERFTNDTEGGGELSRRAKSGFAKTLKRYDRRSIAQNLKFHVEGDGRDRRYLAK